MAKSTTFTLRMSQEDYDLLSSLAAIFNQSIAELAREIMGEGIRERLDPAAIDRRIEKERARLKQAAIEIRDRVERSATADVGAVADREPVAQTANTDSGEGSAEED
ncbi:DUF6290 family protein [Nocardia fluminea]|uniref:DUF6290 family protein n=1 Tax=Nocardia fluminea TaxID=134984 RepID=UPI00366BF094